MSTTIIEMEVDMDCPGCERKVKKALKNIDGVEEIEVDMDNQKVTVIGYATQEKVLKAVRRTGRTAEIWPYPHNPEYMQNLNVQYYQQHQPRDDQGYESSYDSSPNPNNDSSRSYNYYYEHGYYSQPASAYSNMFSEQGTAVFSDDNPNACSIM